MQKQKTIKNKVNLEGVGIHTGVKAKVCFRGAPPNSGINFIRTDLPAAPIIPADASNLLDASLRERRTSIGTAGAEVHTIEHFMAAFFGLGIDNIYVEIDAVEMPGLDGSAKDIIEVLKKGEIYEQDAPQKQLIIKEPIWVEDKEGLLIVLPGSDLSISYTLDYNCEELKPQHNRFVITPENFTKEIAPSRTFCLKKEVNEILSKGLGKGASQDNNTIVLDGEGVPSVDLRFKDEFLRHKVMDIMGDIFLTGCFLKARIIGIKSGHALNLKMAQEIRHRYGIRAQSREKPLMDANDIKKILPHRAPFLMVDEIIELGETTAVGIKYVQNEEYYFRGHFPGRPVMPGVLILEALAQVGGALMLTRPKCKGKIAYFMSINNAKFRKVVKPGDKLYLNVEVTRFKTKTGQVHGKAFVNGAVVAQADLMFALVE